MKDVEKINFRNEKKMGTQDRTWGAQQTKPPHLLPFPLTPSPPPPLITIPVFHLRHPRLRNTAPKLVDRSIRRVESRSSTLCHLGSGRWEYFCHSVQYSSGTSSTPLLPHHPLACLPNVLLSPPRFTLCSSLLGFSLSKTGNGRVFLSLPLVLFLPSYPVASI